MGEQRDVLERGTVRLEHVGDLEPALPCGGKPRDVPHAFAMSARARRARAGGVGEVEIEAKGAEVIEGALKTGFNIAIVGDNDF